MKKVTAIFLSILIIFAAAVPAFTAYETPFEDSLFFEYEDYSIHYRKWEAENAKGQILMLHGFALSSYCWTELAERLVANGYTCVMADLPDFGYSTRETSTTEKLPREDIMHALMKELSDKPWYVAGHSMGGYVAQAIAEKYPEDVVNLLLYGTGGNTNSPFMSKIMGMDIFVAIMGPLMQLMTRFDFLVKLFLKIGLNDNVYASNYDLSKITEPIRIDGTGKGACYSFSMLPNTNFEAIANGKPVLFVNGSSDSVIPDESKNNIREVLPEGSVDYVIEGGGHMFIENLADETAEITLAFLADNPA
ncbi:MAG: alpha/beta hydrolase [Ruminococcaceae bacterium]|nr:alpha/beta hydrolase [Oscillospiraceae bacterium]